MSKIVFFSWAVVSCTSKCLLHCNFVQEKLLVLECLCCSFYTVTCTLNESDLSLFGASLHVPVAGVGKTLWNRAGGQQYHTTLRIQSKCQAKASGFCKIIAWQPYTSARVEHNWDAIKVTSALIYVSLVLKEGLLDAVQQRPVDLNVWPLILNFTADNVWTNCKIFPKTFLVFLMWPLYEKTESENNRNIEHLTLKELSFRQNQQWDFLHSLWKTGTRKSVS